MKAHHFGGLFYFIFCSLCLRRSCFAASSSAINLFSSCMRLVYCAVDPSTYNYFIISSLVLLLITCSIEIHFFAIFCTSLVIFDNFTSQNVCCQ